jgi:hypothetical protein
MGWDWPVISWAKKKLTPDEPVDVPPDENITPDTPADPVPAPAPPLVKPSAINSINYLRAWLLLKKIPFKKLRDEFLKLPLKDLAYIGGLFIWVYMTYTLVMWFLTSLMP